MEAYCRILAGQLVGPLFTILLSSTLLILASLHERLVWWLWLVVLAGPAHTAFAVGGLRHDFRHTVFGECSGIYGTWIDVLCVLGAASIFLLAIVTRRGADRLEISGHQAEQAAP